MSAPLVLDFILLDWLSTRRLISRAVAEGSFQCGPFGGQKTSPTRNTPGYAARGQQSSSDLRWSGVPLAIPGQAEAGLGAAQEAVRHTARVVVRSRDRPGWVDADGDGEGRAGGSKVVKVPSRARRKP